MKTIYDIVNENEDILENRELCSICKGKCCKLAPCYYFPEDIELTKNNLFKMLEDGKTSIKVKVSGFSKNQVNITVPVLYVSARGRKKEAIDLLSLSSRCNSLSSDGCILENKPSGAKILVPGKDGYMNGGNNPCYNILQEKNKLVLEEWTKYYKLLVEVVEEYTNKTFKELYVTDLVKLTAEFLKNKDIINDYNYSFIHPLLKAMGMYDLAYKGLKGNIEKPNKNTVNVLIPSEEIYEKVRKNTK